MNGVYDLQILELAVRHSLRRQTKFLNGLSRSIESYVTPPVGWKAIKDAGKALFSPEKGGSYLVFEKRPLDPRISEYCAQDIFLLFDLEAALRRSFGPWGLNWEGRITAASTARVARARSSVYEGAGRHRAIAPAI